MSSFIISKEEYIKAAGTVAGLAESLPHFWLYDYETGRNATQEDYYRMFTECYTMNAMSVKEQYHDPELFTDGSSYKRTFDDYRKKGRSAGLHRGEDFKRITAELVNFFSSAVYQTEKEPYFWKMQTLFNRITAELMPHILKEYEPRSWGTFEIDEPEPLKRII